MSLEQTLIYLMLIVELIAAIIGLFYLPKLKRTYWKWFCFYLIIMFIQEYFWFDKEVFADISKQEYYAYFGIPIQYVFFYWLYGVKSLRKTILFVAFTVIYLSTFVTTELISLKSSMVLPLNLTVGTILLAILVIMEFNKQITLDNILNFKESKMFYINTGVISYYLGTYPFFAFYNILIEDQYESIWNAYYIYYRISVCLMYLLFIASFIWGKVDSK